MKNKNKLLKFLTIIFVFLISYNKLLANDVLIDAEVVDIKNKGNLIVASGSVNIADGTSVIIEGDRAKYDRINQIVEILGNVFFFDKEKNFKAKSDKIIFDRNLNIVSSFGNTAINLLDDNNVNSNFEVKGKNSIFDQNKKVLEINQNVILKDNLNKFNLYSEKIVYEINKGIFKSFNKTKIDYLDKYFIFTEDIHFNNNKKVFFTKKNTKISDDLKNNFEFSSFNFDLNKKTFKANEIKLYDKENNILELKNGYLDLKSNELIGTDFKFTFNKNFFGNSENDPRLFGRYILTNQSETKMKKSSFTTCKQLEGKCPAWSISADEVAHKKNKKRIEYKNAWLQIYDVPVAYFPYFFHPDPTVERQSGFLFPQFNNSSNLGFSTLIPYYKVIDNDKDLTISPRVFTNNNFFVQTEYRQDFKNSNLITDFSYNKKNSSNAHFFSTLIGDVGDSFYEMKIESVSNKDYLKKYQITSPLINNYSTLNSSLRYEKYAEDYTFSSSANIIKDLTKKDSDKYEYLIPSYEFSKETFLENNIFDTLSFKSSGNYRKFNTNVDEADNVNDFKFTSNSLSAFNNFDSNLNFLIRNVNTYGDLSETYKDDSDYKILTSLLFNLRYPLFKENTEGKKFLTPIASIRFSPNKGINLKNENTLMNFESAFLLDRISNKTVEEGISTTFGLEYKSQNNLDQEKIELGLAINLRKNEDKDIPLSTSLGKKTSDLIGYSGINITENLSVKYNFSIDNNLSETNYSLVSANYIGNKFKTRFEYMEKSKFIGDESYLTNITELEINKSNSIAFETNKNLDKNITDYYNLIYKYKNDCLEASILYNKQFYKEDNINPGQNISFKISFVPFGTIKAPSLND